MGSQMAAEKEEDGKTEEKHKARENREEAGRYGRTGIYWLSWRGEFFFLNI